MRKGSSHPKAKSAQRWSSIRLRQPPIGVLVEIRAPRADHVLLARRVEEGERKSVWETRTQGGRCLSILYATDNMLWRYPGGTAPSKEMLRRVQAAIKARDTRWRNRELALEAERHRKEAEAEARRRAAARRSRNSLVYRIRRMSGHLGGANHYYHADVVARSPEEALQAAREGRVINWRWIDTNDNATRTYCEYEFLYSLPYSEAKKPRKPMTKRELLRQKRTAARASASAATAAAE